MNNSERSAKVETYLSPNSMLCAWMTPEGDIKISLTRIERIDCSGQIVQRKEQIIISEEELSTLKRFFPVIDQFVYFQRFKFIRNVSQQARSISSRTSLSTQTSAQPGVQMDLNSSELPDEIKTIVKEDTVKKIMYYKKTANIPANFVLEMHDINDRDFTRYEVFYCSQK